MEAKGRDFLERVRIGFMELARNDAERWRVLDGAAPPEIVAAAGWDAVTEKM